MKRQRIFHQLILWLGIYVSTGTVINTPSQNLKVDILRISTGKLKKLIELGAPAGYSDNKLRDDRDKAVYDILGDAAATVWNQWSLEKGCEKWLKAKDDKYFYYGIHSNSRITIKELFCFSSCMIPYVLLYAMNKYKQSFCI